MNDKVTSIPNVERDKGLAALEAIKRAAPMMIGLATTLATIRKASYDAHIKAGFSPEQALELCKQVMP